MQSKREAGICAEGIDGRLNTQLLKECSWAARLVDSGVGRATMGPGLAGAEHNESMLRTILRNPAQRAHVVFVELVPGKSLNGVLWSVWLPQAGSAEGVAKRVRRTASECLLQKLWIALNASLGQVLARVKFVVAAGPEKFFQHKPAHRFPVVI